MAVQANGKTKKSKKELPNGNTNDLLMNNHQSRAPKRVRRRQGLIARAISTSTRILLWYTILTAVFRCPSSSTELSEDSPRLCKPYLSIRSRAAPYLQPYYEAHLAPHVDKARPHVDRFNKNIYTPAAAFTTRQYSIYGAPRVAQAQAYALDEWEKTVRPHLELAQERAKEQYDIHMGPHVDKVYTVVEPHFSTAKSIATDKYHTVVFPAYEKALPYVQKGYTEGHRIAVDIVFPYMLHAEASTVAFLQRTIWPQLRVLYGDNVEPQLMRISERLGRYKDSKKVDSPVDDIDSSSNISSLESDDDEGITTALSSTAAASPSTAETPSPSPQKKFNETEVRERIKTDLRTWQEKFAKAADKGSEDLQERVKEITKRQIEGEAMTSGQTLLEQLEEISKSSIETLKSQINNIVGGLPELPTEEDLDKANQQATAAIRECGVAIKEKAQALREWKKTFNQETFNLIRSATMSTLVVIDNIRDLGLQEIGMRWAWMDGVTYKDWAKYHELKQTFDEWRAEVEAVAKEHPGLKQAHNDATTIEDKGMEIAQTAAKELVRLKGVAAWKIQAHDATDDFSSKDLPPRVKNVAQKVVEEGSEAGSIAVDSLKAAKESVISGGSAVFEGASSSVSSAIDRAESNVADSATEKAPEAVVKGTESVEQVMSVVGNKPASSLVPEHEPKSDSSISMEPEASSMTETIASAENGATEQPSEALHETNVAEAPSAVEVEPPAVPEISPDDEPEQSKKVWGGAMAQEVKPRNVIYDDDLVSDSDEQEYSEKLQEVFGHAGDRAAEITRAILDALIKPKPTQGVVESATSVVNDRYERALSAASSVLYGTSTGTAEIIASAASDKYAQAVTAASYAIYGTPTSGPLESISSVASSRLAEGLSKASVQYSSVRSALHAEPTPDHQKYLLDARKRYYEVIGALHAQYSDFVDSASSVVYGTPTPVYESAASAVGSQIGSVSSVASKNWAELVSRASEEVYGQPTPWAELAVSRAGDYGSQATSAAVAQYSAVSAIISELVVGHEPAFTESVMSRLSSAYYTAAPAVASSASSIASEVYGSASSVAASVFTPPAALETILTGATDQINAAVDAISVKVYGTEPSYLEAAQISLAAIASSVQSAASEAVYGTPTGKIEAATSSAASAYSSISSAVSSAVYGPEQKALESVSSRLAVAISSAQARLSEVGAAVGDATKAASSKAEEVASSVSSAASSITERVKDEL